MVWNRNRVMVLEWDSAKGTFLQWMWERVMEEGREVGGRRMVLHVVAGGQVGSVRDHLLSNDHILVPSQHQEPMWSRFQAARFRDTAEGGATKGSE